jgi:cytochrome c peroxidase
MPGRGPRGPSRRAALAALAALVALAAACAAPAAETVVGQAAGDRRATAARDGWVRGIDSLRAALVRLDGAARALDGTPGRTADAQMQFRHARLAYKRVEAAATYYEPSTTDLMNGPALPRVEDDEGPETVFAPEGFQVVEELLFPTPDPEALSGVAAETGNLIDLATRLRTAAVSQVVTDDRVWDAAKLEIARVATLGITGFDSPIARHGLPEAAAALGGVRSALAPFATDGARARGGEPWRALDAALAGAIAAVDSARDVDAFDRYAFIVRHANPLAHALDRARAALGIEPPRERRAFAMRAASLFDSAAFDPQGFAHPAAEPDTPARAALGRRLFHDARLSGGGTRSCAACHDPARAFTDGRARSAPLPGRDALRNAPTVINAGLQVGSFYDLRTTYLEDQVADVVGSPSEMHGSLDATAALLAADSGYARAFAAAFPAPTDGAVNGTRVRTALAAYLRSLNGLNSRADRALRGDSAAWTPTERRGFNLFMGKAKCATCHFAPLYNGTVPPLYQDAEVEVIGVPSRPVWRGARVDPDSGRFRLTRAAPHLHAFKTPTVRNVALTAPYMHNGVYRTLDEVVDFYDRGGGAGIGVALDNQTLPPDSLRLTPAERRSLVAFMRALTDTAGLTLR